MLRVRSGGMGGDMSPASTNSGPPSKKKKNPGRNAKTSHPVISIIKSQMFFIRVACKWVRTEDCLWGQGGFD